MTRSEKIELIKSIQAGKVDQMELLASKEDGFFVQCGNEYAGNGIRYTEKQFNKLSEILDRKGIKVQIFKVGESQTFENFIKSFTKPLNNGQKAKNSAAKTD